LAHCFVTRRLPGPALDRLAAEHETEVWPEPLPPPREALLARAPGWEGLISLPTDRIDAELIERAPQLSAISNYAVGYDNIDLAAAATRGIPVGQYVSWTRGVLWFHEAPLRSVMAQLGRWYDLDIAVSDASLAAETLTMSFGPQSADEALTALAKVLDVRFTRTGRSVLLISSPLDSPHSHMEDD